MMYSLDSLDRPSARVIGRDGDDDDYDDDGTIELELNEAAIEALNEAAAVALAASEGRAEPCRGDSLPRAWRNAELVATTDVFAIAVPDGVFEDCG